MSDNSKPNGGVRFPAPPPPVVRRSLPTGQSLGTPNDFHRGPGQASQDGPADPQPEQQAGDQPAPQGPRKQSTETIAQRAGALTDEIDFPVFVASLVHGTFDAIVDASIRQMESYASLVSAVAKSVEEFTADNVTLNQARDYLVEQHPEDLQLDLTSSPKAVPKPAQGEDPDQARSPDWLKDYGLEGEDLTPELVEDTLVPLARNRVGQSRQQTLASMVLLGLNRVVVKDGSVSARLRFRASASDQAKVNYAVSDDPSGGQGWGQRGSGSYQLATTKVSTVGVNVQSDADLKAELFGEVKINFASETLPLDRFADEAKRTLLERRAKPATTHATPKTPPKPSEIVAESQPAPAQLTPPGPK